MYGIGRNGGILVLVMVVVRVALMIRKKGMGIYGFIEIVMT